MPVFRRDLVRWSLTSRQGMAREVCSPALSPTLGSVYVRVRSMYDGSDTNCYALLIGSAQRVTTPVRRLEEVSYSRLHDDDKTNLLGC